MPQLPSRHTYLRDRQ
ncbi:MAG: hypothetical protein EBS70_00770 [Actinobacteria bacterium]|nr:hypothetical protein [Actinomycetota bacterium]NBT27211.1 hypothetical protein [Actinomycetota bacterium]NCZ90781.1 hypothetical protein [Actinomycetota bacterium]